VTGGGAEAMYPPGGPNLSFPAPAALLRMTGEGGMEGHIPPMLAAQDGFRSGPWPGFHKISG